RWTVAAFWERRRLNIGRRHRNIRRWHGFDVRRRLIDGVGRSRKWRRWFGRLLDHVILLCNIAAYKRRRNAKPAKAAKRSCWEFSAGFAGFAFTRRVLNVQADGSHQRQCVAVLDDPGSHPVIEDHPAIL